MKHSFIDLMREPDSVLFQYDDSGKRFEEPDGREECLARIDYKLGKVILYPSEKGIKRIKLRWRGDMSDVILVMRDAYGRFLSEDIPWMGLSPKTRMPWYFNAYDGEKLNCFGVKTGPSAFCFFECDAFGITLWLDVRSGGTGVKLREPMTLAEVVCREGRVGENPYIASKAFCSMMCSSPNLPKQPVFGVNNWYWAYGNITHESVMQETEYLMEMCVDAVCKPYMTIDDGWQKSRYKAGHKAYNGGPWDGSNDGFPSMQQTAESIKEMGAKPGIWFRPLKTAMQIPAEALSKSDCVSEGVSLDPTHPFVKELVERDVKRIIDWGYELIKHDFSTIDSLTSQAPMEDSEIPLYDRSIPNCEALRRLYLLIQESAGDAVVIGCNTINHLAAGIHQVQRVGMDTSGYNFEQTRTYGVRSFVRLPQNGTFFAHDPDCAAFTSLVSHELNLDFMEACAISGAATLASVTPGCLSNGNMARIRGIYKIASEGGLGAYPKDWLGKNEPSQFVCADGTEKTYNFYRVHDGVRQFYSWFD